jgi:hypothetical protein
VLKAHQLTVRDPMEPLTPCLIIDTDNFELGKFRPMGPLLARPAISEECGDASSGLRCRRPSSQGPVTIRTDQLHR